MLRTLVNAGSRSLQRKRRAVLAAAALACLAAPAMGQAQQVTLRAVSSFDEKTFFSRHFERFVEKVNREGKGLVQINYIGGPKAIPPFEVGNAVRNKVVDLANVTGVFYTNIVPEAIAMSYTDLTTRELRENGAIDYMNTLLAPKGLTYLARLSDGVPYHIYTNKGFTGDLKGQKMRITPVYRDLFLSLGSTVVQTAPGELYTALERGVVDGYGWPIAGIFDLGWQEKTRYRVDPGFYGSENGILMNLSSWKNLTQAQRDFLQKQFAWAEEQNATYKDEVAAETRRQAEAGVKTIALSPEDSRKLLDAARDAAWKRMAEVSPAHAAKLKSLFSRP